MHYQPVVRKIVLDRCKQTRILTEESLIMLIRLAVLPLCLVIWYGIFKFIRAVISWLS